jgi:hypothetical protein
MKLPIASSLILLALSAPAWADKAAYCQAYARDFSDQRTTDKVTWQHKFQIALDACLANHTPLVARAAVVTAPVAKDKLVKPIAVAKPAVTKPAPPVPVKPATELVAGTQAWNDYCAKKYTSFNVKTGMYLSKTGVERHCLVTKDFKG